VLITRSIVGLLHVDHAPACEDGDGVVESREQEAQTDTHTHNYEQLPCPVSMYTAPEIGECMVNEMQLCGEVLIIQI
jgi:hypothetical protein